MSKIINITNELGSLQTNCYILGNTETREAIVIDPADQAHYIKKCLDDSNLKCVGIFLTHGHIDHIGAMDQLRKLLDVKCYASRDEQMILESQGGNLSAMLGWPMTTKADVYLVDGQELKIMGTTIKCISVPGHTIGGMCFYVEEGKVLYSGDTLFAGSIGRSDFPTGDGELLIESIKDKIFALPGETVVYPGHGPYTTIKKERVTNPFFM